MDVLERGDGTERQAIPIARLVPGSRVHVDVDPKILALARDRVTVAGVQVSVHEG